MRSLCLAAVGLSLKTHAVVLVRAEGGDAVTQDALVPLTSTLPPHSLPTQLPGKHTLSILAEFLRMAGVRFLAVRHTAHIMRMRL